MSKNKSEQSGEIYPDEISPDDNPLGLFDADDLDKVRRRRERKMLKNIGGQVAPPPTIKGDTSKTSSLADRQQQTEKPGDFQSKEMTLGRRIRKRIGETFEMLVSGL